MRSRPRGLIALGFLLTAQRYIFHSRPRSYFLETPPSFRPETRGGENLRLRCELAATSGTASLPFPGKTPRCLLDRRAHNGPRAEATFRPRSILGSYLNLLSADSLLLFDHGYGSFAWQGKMVRSGPRTGRDALLLSIAKGILCDLIAKITSR